MQLDDWLTRLENLHFKSIDMGLERIQAVAERLELFTDLPFIFTIAGTNGKGSTVSLIDCVLRGAGYRTGVYTSPHLVQFNERICVNGDQCTDQKLISAFERVEAERGDVSLTYFEFTTLAAIVLFKEANLDAWILEVGLGGRLDAVNVWDASIAVVTSIDLDHQAWLGHDRASIGIEKIGIARGGKPLILGEPDVPAPVLSEAKSSGAMIYRLNHDFSFDQSASSWRAELCTKDGPLKLEQLPIPRIYLQNATVALQALELSPFSISRAQICQGLAETSVRGRRQLVHQNPDIILDVGHNPHAALALSKHLATQSYRKVYCVVGMLADKDILGTLLALLPVVERWIPVDLQADRACSGKQIREYLLELGAVTEIPRPSASYACRQLVKKVQHGDLILVFGSFYTVADVIQYSGLVTQ